jgi:GntR family transcriptional regulator
MFAGITLQNNGIPIYVQLREQIAAAVGTGKLPPGAQLPTMRQLAVTLKIDLNTVQRAYAELEREGILTMIQGRGSFVAEPPAPRRQAAETRTFAARIAAQAQAQGVTLADLIVALRELAASAP